MKHDPQDWLDDFLSPYRDTHGVLVDIEGALNALERFCECCDGIHPDLRQAIDLEMSALRGL